MKKYSALAVVLGAAIPFTVQATNITLYDGVSGGGFSGGGTGVGLEDNEVENGAVTGQIWDLEAFDLNGTSLSLWGGYNFEGGQSQGGNLWGSGDIFIDVNGDATWGAGTDRSTSNSYYDYDYAVVFNRSGEALTGGYQIVSLDSTSTVLQTYNWSGTLFDWSNPFRVDNAGANSQVIDSGTFGYQTGISDANSIGLLGDSHNVLTIELGALSALLGGLDGALFHFTMECGNDGINGRAPVPDGGAALCLFGLGMGAIGLLRRRLR
jgi:hypothetical protein